MNTPSPHNCHCRLGVFACQKPPSLVLGYVSNLRLIVSAATLYLGSFVSRYSTSRRLPGSMLSRFSNLFLTLPCSSTCESTQAFIYCRYFGSPVLFHTRYSPQRKSDFA